MRPSLTCLAAVAAISIVSASAALAECKRFGFSVNDYGKDGPTKDAKDLLDKHIATKMSERGVSNYQTGKKDVKCELFLDFIVFDEHTCTAEATVCWGGTALPKSQQAAAPEGGVKPAKATTTGSIDKKAKPAASTETKPPAAADEPLIEGGRSAEAPAAAVATPAPAAPAPEEAPTAAAPEPAIESEAPAATEPVSPTP